MSEDRNDVSLANEAAPVPKSDATALATTSPEADASNVGVKEVSEEFDTRSTRIGTKDKEFWLVTRQVSEQKGGRRYGQEIWLVNFEGDKAEAEQALGVIRHYGINERVTLSDQTGQHKFVYWLCDGRGPVGAFPGARDANMRVFNPMKMEIQGKYLRASGNGGGNISFGPYQSKEFSEKVLEAIKVYGFTCKCSLGERNAHFTYLFR